MVGILLLFDKYKLEKILKDLGQGMDFRVLQTYRLSEGTLK